MVSAVTSSPCRRDECKVSDVVRRLVVLLAVALAAGVAFAGSGGGSSVTQPIIDAIDGAGDGLLGPIGTLLGILVTVAIGFAIVRTVRS